MRLLLVGMLVLTGLIGAPQAGADPEDLMPYCSGGQTPANNNCRASVDQTYGESDQTHSNNAPGANPGVPVGVDPGHSPAV